MHQPVLLKEVLKILNPQPGQTCIDATVNGGGHARAIAERIGNTGRVIGIDWDCGIIKQAEIKNRESGITNIDLVCDTYTNMTSVMRERNITAVDGVLFDLGFSSYHLDRSGRGLSFSKDEPLDMRYHCGDDHGNDKRPTAAAIINTYGEKELTDIFLNYGEERFARRIARKIVEERREKNIASSAHLADIVWRAYPRPARRGRIHPATRVFQALRIAVNDELASLSSTLPAAASLLSPGGTIAIIAFHSLEDRIAKTFIREKEKEGILRSLNKKPVTAARREIAMNPRARSARLRAAVKI